MRLKIALLALPLALLAAFFVYFIRPQLGAAPAAGSTAGAPSSVAGSAGTSLAPGTSSTQGARFMDQSSLSADTTPTLLRAITVVGQGEVKIAPDVAFVTVGVRNREKTAMEAQEKTNQAMDAVIAKIKSLGIADKDIQTSGINLWPVYERDSLISGYEASNTVTVQVEIAKVGPLIDAAVEAGANNSLSIGFGLKDPSAATLQALEAASKEARTRADAIARGLGVTVKDVQIAVEETTSSPVAMRDASYALKAAEGAMSAPTPVQPGEMTVTSRVRVTYSY